MSLDARPSETPLSVLLQAKGHVNLDDLHAIGWRELRVDSGSKLLLDWDAAFADSSSCIGSTMVRPAICNHMWHMCNADCMILYPFEDFFAPIPADLSLTSADFHPVQRMHRVSTKVGVAPSFCRHSRAPMVNIIWKQQDLHKIRIRALLSITVTVVRWPEDHASVPWLGFYQQCSDQPAVSTIFCMYRIIRKGRGQTQTISCCARC